MSPSRAKDFTQCALLYRFRAVDRLPEPVSRAQVRGTLVHAVLEALFALPAQERVPARAHALAVDVWQRIVAEDAAVAECVPPAEHEGMLRDAHTLLDTYFTLEDPTAVDAALCEMLVETEIPAQSLRVAGIEPGAASEVTRHLPTVPLRGIVDRLDVSPTGEVRVVDYKTGRAPSERAESAALFQLEFYAAMLARTRGTVPSELRLMYLGSGTVLTYRPDAERLARVERTLAAMWSAIVDTGATGAYEPSPSRMCRWCSHRALCPAFGGTPPPYPGRPAGGEAAPSASTPTEVLPA
ncbi:PD-(D/E)XK nuclease family protein [Rhodococcus sp. HNM0569]|uniref:RecB family exonuclease n=1 Tax=Rhodococcus sp. HNM0569 TaxID=2716340 RepID=UPI001F10A266|nr:PD-(D/E)XK nuclease family protein [Rhodococcus sp. HNM0569]